MHASADRRSLAAERLAIRDKECAHSDGELESKRERSIEGAWARFQQG